MKPDQLLPIIRRVVLIAAGIGTIYIGWRFDLFSMPPESCSPLMSLRPGTHMLLDTRASTFDKGDVVLYTTPTGGVAIGQVQATQPGSDGPDYWIITDAPDCDVPDSDDWGWIPSSNLNARLVLSGSF